MATIHASCVLFAGAGVLIRGASGAGKSRLAHILLLRAPVYGIAASLVADDRVEIEERDGAPFARPPAALAGLLEVRGLGLVRLPFAAEARLSLALDLLPAAEIPRLPDPGEAQIPLGAVTLPRAFAASPETALDALLTMVGQAGATLDPDDPLASVRFDGKTTRP